MQTVMLSFSANDKNFCVFTHEFENRIVFVGTGEIQDAFNAIKFNQILQIEILRRLGDPETTDEPKVTVKIYDQNLTEHQAKVKQIALIEKLNPVWQVPFDYAAYSHLAHILCVQTKQVFPTLYAAAKALNMSMTTAYGTVQRPVAWRRAKGYQLVRTTRPVTVAEIKTGNEPPPLPGKITG